MSVAEYLNPPTHFGRYSTKAVSLEIAAAIKRRGRGTHKDLAAHMGWTSQQLSHRLAVDTTRWRIEQIGAIAEFFKAPPGWPFVAWDVAQAAFGR